MESTCNSQTRNIDLLKIVWKWSIDLIDDITKNNPELIEYFQENSWNT